MRTVEAATFHLALAFTTGPVELERWIKAGEDNLVIVEVREEDDFAKGHIPGAINLPRNCWQNPQGLSKNKTNVVYCYTQQCHLAANACLQFASMDYPVMELECRFAAWRGNQMDIEEPPIHRFRQSSDRTTTRT
jgi:rhodanese-related sulfurtransferase